MTSLGSAHSPEFVGNEIVVKASDSLTLDAVLDSVPGAEVIDEFHPSDFGLAGAFDRYLVYVEPPSVTAQEAANAVRATYPCATGVHSFTSQQGLDLFALVAQLRATGLPVALNMIGEPDSIQSGQTADGPLPNAAGSWDAFGPTILQSGGALDIGVTSAWQLLYAAGTLPIDQDDRQYLGVTDSGFSTALNPSLGVAGTNPDWPTITLAADPGESNPWGTSSSWHGTSVVLAALAKPDNNFGTAGPAGDVANLIMVRRNTDAFRQTQALLVAFEAGASVITNSAHTTVTPEWYFPLDSYEDITEDIFAAGVPIFSSAGNDGEDVDSETCTCCDCWEDEWVMPCENDGVVCVGGVDSNGVRDPGSNYGSKGHVRIFAPFTQVLGPDPSAAQQLNTQAGTSFSTPFVAAVAMLVRTANPEMQAKEVVQLLVDTASVSSDPDVYGIVNARRAVFTAMGLSTFISVQQPTHDQVFWLAPTGAEVPVQALVQDITAQNPSIRWFLDNQTVDAGGVSATNLVLHAVGVGSHTLRILAVSPSDTAVSTWKERTFRVVAPDLRISAHAAITGADSMVLSLEVVNRPYQDNVALCAAAVAGSVRISWTTPQGAPQSVALNYPAVACNADGVTLTTTVPDVGSCDGTVRFQVDSPATSAAQGTSVEYDESNNIIEVPIQCPDLELKALPAVLGPLPPSALGGLLLPVTARNILPTQASSFALCSTISDSAGNLVGGLVAAVDPLSLAGNSSVVSPLELGFLQTSFGSWDPSSPGSSRRAYYPITVSANACPGSGVPTLPEEHFFNNTVASEILVTDDHAPEVDVTDYQGQAAMGATSHDFEVTVTVMDPDDAFVPSNIGALVNP